MNTPKLDSYKLQFEPYFIGPIPFGHDERIVEVPWVMHHTVGDKVLDVGCAYASNVYFDALSKLNIKELHGFDMSPAFERGKEKYQSMYIYKSGDASKQLPYEQDYFDTIICLSTIEHFGMDNSWYWDDRPHPSRNNDDKLALANMINVLKPEGRLLITVPYGAVHNEPRFKQYTKDSLFELLGNNKIEEIQYFFYNGKGWIHANADMCRNARYSHFGFLAAQAIACIILTK